MAAINKALVAFRHALAFLTRLPGGSHPTGQVDIVGSVVYFPVVGLLVGLLGSGAYLIGVAWFSAAVGAVLCLSITALVTGALHEDGLADSMDALAGGWDREQRLEIFKDSTHGTFGVMSLVLVSLLKFSALAGLATLSRTSIVLIVVAAHVVGRSAAVVAMGVLPPARDSGLGATYGTSLPVIPMAGAGLLGAVGLVAAFGLLAPVALVSVVFVAVGFGAWSMRKIGGSTGDILGSIEQLSECAVLLSAFALL